MSKSNFSDEFKRDAVAQITERGYPVAEVSERLGVSQHLYRPRFVTTLMLPQRVRSTVLVQTVFQFEPCNPSLRKVVRRQKLAAKIRSEILYFR
jgi:hypothetical protein